MECPKCHSGFNRDKNKPLMLSCDHTICSTCASNETLKSCIECSKPFGPDLKPNYALLDLLEGHKTYFTDIQSTNILVKETSRPDSICGKSSQPNNRYCTDCKLLICSSCFTLEHSHHLSRSLSVDMYKFISDFSTFRESINDSISDLKSLDSRLGLARKETLERKVSLPGEIETSLDAIVAKILALKAAMIISVNISMNNSQAAIDNCIKSIKEVSSVLKKANKELNSLNDKVIASSYSPNSDMLQKLIATHTNSQDATMKVTNSIESCLASAAKEYDDHRNKIDELGTSIQSFEATLPEVVAEETSSLASGKKTVDSPSTQTLTTLERACEPRSEEEEEPDVETSSPSRIMKSVKWMMGWNE